MPENTVSELVAAEVVEEPRKPWGFWMTMLLSLIIMAVFFVIQIGVLLLIIVLAIALGNLSSQASSAEMYNFITSGWILAATTWASLPFTLGSMYLFVKLRKRWSMSEYLGWKRVSLRQACLWLAAIVIFLAGELFLWWQGLAGNDSGFTKHICETAFWPPLVWVTLLIAAPLSEECFFRGFLFRGIQASALGNVGAILITSVLWAAIHLQYNLYQIILIFLIGGLLGTARARTGSSSLTMVMHLLVNLSAMLEIYLFG